LRLPHVRDRHATGFYFQILSNYTQSWCQPHILSICLTRIVINSALMLRRRRNDRAEGSLDEILDVRPDQLQDEIVIDAVLDSRTNL
jgi:hypothetical protein